MPQWDADTGGVITKDLLKWMWALLACVLVGYASLARLMGGDVSILLVALYALVVPPLVFGAFLVFMGWMVMPVTNWWQVRTRRADWWEVRDYLLLFPTPVARINQTLGWRRRAARTTKQAGSSLGEVAEALRPHYEKKHPTLPWLGAGPTVAATSTPAVDRSLDTALDWLRDGLDPTLLVACLQAQVSDERIDAHRTGAEVFDEASIRVLAALRA